MKNDEAFCTLKKWVVRFKQFAWFISSMEILLLAGTYYLAANGILRFTQFLNAVKQAESEGLVSSRNYALLMLVNIVTLNTCQNMGLYCLFSNTTVSPIAGLAGRVPLLTSELTEI